MHRRRQGAFLGATFLVWASVAGAACQNRQEAMPDPVIEAGAADASRVTLLAVDPPGKSPVQADSVVTVDVEYHVAGFQPRKHFVTAQFQTQGAGTTSIVTSEGPQYLDSATGRVRLCLPLASLYANESMRWPLTFEVILHEGQRRTSEILARTSMHRLNPSDTPAAALARQAAMPTPEYQGALRPVFGFFETQDAFKDVCVRRFPDLAEELQQKYAQWLEPHAALAERVSREQLDLFRQAMRGHEAYAERAHESTRLQVAERHASTPDFALRKQCDQFLRSFGTDRMNPEVAYASQLRILRDDRLRKPTDET